MARILVIRQFYFPQDPRVRREVEALTGAGHAVDVLCMRRPGEAARERVGGATVRRLPIEHRRGGMRGYVVEYTQFLLAAALMAAWMHLRRRYQLVQVNSLPDTLVFAAIGPKLLGARVLLDLHECMPEFFGTKFKAGPHHPLTRAVARAEQASIRFADRVITCTDQMKQAFVARGAPPEKIDVVLNAADESIFDPSRAPRAAGRDGCFTLVMHGAVEERYGLDTVVRAVALLERELPELRFVVYGEGEYLADLRRLVRALGVESRVEFKGFVPIDELVRGIAAADLGVVAMKRDAFRDLTQCNKMYDFIAMRVPVVTSRTRSVAESFPPSALAFFESDDHIDLARVIRALRADPRRRAALVETATRANEPYRWPHQRARYLEIVDGAVRRRMPLPVAARAAEGVTL